MLDFGDEDELNENENFENSDNEDFSDAFTKSETLNEDEFFQKVSNNFEPFEPPKPERKSVLDEPFDFEKKEQKQTMSFDERLMVADGVAQVLDLGISFISAQTFGSKTRDPFKAEKSEIKTISTAIEKVLPANLFLSPLGVCILAIVKVYTAKILSFKLLQENENLKKENEKLKQKIEAQNEPDSRDES